MKKSKLNLINDNLIWNASRRYKINSVVQYNDVDYQNITGLNSVPDLLIDWQSQSNGSSELKVENSAGAINGFAITDNGDGTVNIASGQALLRSTNSETGVLAKYTLPAITGLTLTDDANNFVLVNYNSGTPIITVTIDPSTINTTTNSLLYVIARYGTSLHYVYAGNQNVDSNGKLRRRFLNSEAFSRAYGAVISFSNRNLILSSGLFYSGLSPYATPAYNTNTPDTFTEVYKNSGWVRTASKTQINNTQYNNAGTLTTMANNKFRVDYVYVLIDNPCKLYVVLGDAEYTTIALARLATIPSTLPVELQRLGVLVGRVIIEKSASAITEIASNFEVKFTNGSVTNHNDLGGLNVGDYQHLTAAEKANVAYLASPTFTGTPSAPTATVGTNTTQLATTAFVLANAGSGDMTLGTAQTVTALKTFTNTPSVTGGITINNTNTNTSTGNGQLINSSGFIGLKVTGSGTYGIYTEGTFPIGINAVAVNNTTAIRAYNAGSGSSIGFYSQNTDVGLGIYSRNESSGIGMRLENLNSATGKPFQYTKNNVEKAFINDAGDFSAQSITVLGTLGLRNVANTFTSLFTNTNTAARTYTLPNRDITFAGLDDIGLVALDEGNGIGYVIGGRNAANYGSVGLGAVDLSYSESASSSRGAIGLRAVVSGGQRNTASDQFASVGGGADNTASNQFARVGGGYNNTASAQQSVVAGGNGNLASGYQSGILGGVSGIASGYASGVLNGELCKARSYGEVVGGINPTDYTPTSATSWSATDRIFNIGNGANSGVLSDALTILKNGLATLPSVTNALITAEGTGKAVVTKEFLDVPRVFKPSGYTVSTLPTGTLGDMAYVTDALTPTYLGALIGGGAVKCPVFYNGTMWISH